jgi:hypothetical protein
LRRDQAASERKGRQRERQKLGVTIVPVYVFEDTTSMLRSSEANSQRRSRRSKVTLFFPPRTTSATGFERQPVASMVHHTQRIVAPLASLARWN